MDSKTIQAIYAMLTSQEFDDWYTQDFASHMQGETEAPSTKEVLNNIKQMVENRLAK